MSRRHRAADLAGEEEKGAVREYRAESCNRARLEAHESYTHTYVSADNNTDLVP